MSQIKLMMTVAGLSLFVVNSASAQPGWGYHHRHYWGPPVYAYPPVVAPPPVIVAPPPVVTPGPIVAPAPAPVYAPPVTTYVAPAPYYAPSYSYGVVGPRGFGFGYATPGFGMYFGR